LFIFDFEQIVRNFKKHGKKFQKFQKTDQEQETGVTIQTSAQERVARRDFSEKRHPRRTS
jgi:hypothetical protein